MAKRSKTDRMLGSFRGRPEPKQPLGKKFFMPNHSGISIHPEFIKYVAAQIFWERNSNIVSTKNIDDVVKVGSDLANGNYVYVVGAADENTYTVFKGERKYPKFVLKDTWPAGAEFNFWNLGKSIRFGTNTGTAGNSSWYCRSGDAGNCIFNGDMGIGTSTPDARLQVIGDVKIGDDDTNYVIVHETGVINFVGTAGLSFGQIYAEGLTSNITSVAQNDWDQIVAFDTDGEENGSVYANQVNSHIDVTVAGRYLVTFQWTGTGPANSHDWDFEIGINNGATKTVMISSHVRTPSAQNLVSCSATGILDLAANDTVELWTKRISAGSNIVLTTHNCSITVSHLGGT